MDAQQVAAESASLKEKINGSLADLKPAPGSLQRAILAQVVEQIVNCQTKERKFSNILVVACMGAAAAVEKIQAKAEEFAKDAPSFKLLDRTRKM